jgi:hypothetical protein
VPLKRQKRHSRATHRSGSTGSPTSQACGWISDDGNAERHAREPSNDVLDLDLRVVIEEGNEYAKTDQARRLQQSENLRAAITVSWVLRFHGCEHYPHIAYLTCAEGHERRRRRMTKVITTIATTNATTATIGSKTIDAGCTVGAMDTASAQSGVRSARAFGVV